MNEITPLTLKAWMKNKKITQVALAEMLGTTHTSIGRWLKGVHSISGPEKKLLAYLMFGELPFDVQTASDGWELPFTESEFAVIQLLARREGYSSAENWVVAKIRAYLAMCNAQETTTLKAVDEGAAYKTKKSSI
jgi:transcriptional regulator with XRE-family HTH domain